MSEPIPPEVLDCMEVVPGTEPEVEQLSPTTVRVRETVRFRQPLSPEDRIWAGMAGTRAYRESLPPGPTYTCVHMTEVGDRPDLTPEALESILGTVQRSRPFVFNEAIFAVPADVPEGEEQAWLLKEYPSAAREYQDVGCQFKKATPKESMPEALVQEVARQVKELGEFMVERSRGLQDIFRLKPKPRGKRPGDRHACRHRRSKR